MEFETWGTGDTIKTIAKIIFGLGFLAGVFLGFVTGRIFNWGLMLIIWASTFFSGLFVYIGGTIVDLLESISGSLCEMGLSVNDNIEESETKISD